MGYIYLIYTFECIKDNINVYKIGRTNRHYNNRIKEYSSNSITYLIIQTNNSILLEKQILDYFKNNYCQMIDYGREYFQGNVNDMAFNIFKIVNEYNIVNNNFIEESYNYINNLDNSKNLNYCTEENNDIIDNPENINLNFKLDDTKLNKFDISYFDELNTYFMKKQYWENFCCKISILNYIFYIFFENENNNFKIFNIFQLLNECNNIFRKKN